jgi:hypothetical protein
VSISFDVTVIVSTFGSHAWAEQGVLTARMHKGRHHHHVGHGQSLGAVRNQAVHDFDPQGFICFLDAGDWLWDGYMDEMWFHRTKTNDLLTPKLKLGLRPPQKLWNQRDIMVMNPCPIGTLIHRDVFDRVGGFWDEPAYEDWSLFRRAVLTGSEVVGTGAIYHAPSSPDGRNSTVPDPAGLCASIIKSHDEWMATR